MKTLTTWDDKIVSHNVLWPPTQNEYGMWELGILGGSWILDFLGNYCCGGDLKVDDIIFKLLCVKREPFAPIDEIERATLIFRSVWKMEDQDEWLFVPSSLRGRVDERWVRHSSEIEEKQ